jgi:hypothetical protein
VRNTTLSATIIEQLENASDPMIAIDEAFVALVEKEGGAEQAAKAKGFFENFHRRQTSEMATMMSAELRRATNIACFCESGTSLTLWSYYSDRHRGLCVEYPINEIELGDLRRHWLHPVNYATNRFNLDWLIDRLMTNPKQLNPLWGVIAAIHKSPDWRHEQEWRIIDPTREKPGGWAIRMPQPSRVFLGCQMEPDYRQSVVGIAQHLGIALHEMTLSADRFELETKPAVTGLTSAAPPGPSTGG